MVNQQTPYGSLTYSQTGQNFTPSDNGSTYYYNPSTGQYTSTMPTSMVSTTTGGKTVNLPNGQTMQLGGTTGSSSQLADGWQQVTGYMTPSYTATQTLSPEQQAIYDQQSQATLNLATLANQQSAFMTDYLGNPIDLSGAPALNTTVGNGYSTSLSPDYVNSMDAYQGVFDDTYNAMVARQQPTMDANQASLESQLYAKGIRPGTEAWDSELARMSSANNDFYNSAYLGAQNAALQQAQFTNNSILAGQGFTNSAAMQQANFENAARTQYMNEAYAERNQPINEVTALMSGSQVTNPNFVSTPQSNVAPVDYMGLVSDQYQAQAAQSSAMMGGLFGLAAAPFSMFSIPKITSDRRLKRDIQQIGHIGRLPWYRFNYVWDAASAPSREGFMSDDVRKVAPHAVTPDAAGYDAVDYALAMEAA